MKQLRNLILVTGFCSFVQNGFSQKADTLTINASNVQAAQLNYGKRSYLVYNKKSKESPSERLVLVKILVEKTNHEGKPTISITQQWDADTVMHSAYTVLDGKDLSTIEHDFYWKRLGYSSKYDFVNKIVSFDGPVPDSVKTKSINDFNESFDSYNLNWHSDLVIFPLLPYKENRTFKIRFYDPGFGKAVDVFYSVAGSDTLITSAGEKILCWTLEHKLTGNTSGYQKFWISKKGNEVIKEEDLFNGRYRYKIRLTTAE